MKSFIYCSTVFAILALAPILKAEAPPGSDYHGNAFTLHKISDTVYHAVGTGNLAVGCNGAVVINEEDVLVVDSHMTPAAAWALQRELKVITDKPIRYLVNTHFHFDHTHGNQIFGPEVEIIAHTFTRDKLVRGESQQGRAYESFVLTLPENIAAAEERLASLEGEKKEKVEEQILGMKKFWQASEAVVPKPPTLTLERSLTIQRGGREIQLLFVGRGHTGGDVVVFLPDEKVLITGDLLTEGLPYMGDAYPLDWVETLEVLKTLDFEVALPGHGRAFEGKAKLDHLQDYLLDLWHEASKMHTRQATVEEAAKTIDLTAHGEHFPQIAGPGVSDHAVARIYELLDERVAMASH
jgi:glyoxylase-like metal-dependent hydrolase (beta-lactamase superfamily II)